MRTIQVQLGTRSYPIYIESGAINRLPQLLRSHGLPPSVGLVSAPPVYDRYGAIVTAALEQTCERVITALIPDGEDSKTIEQAILPLYDAFLEGGLDRSSALVALGGGVVGDVTGFTAATLFRGVRLFQIPSTLLAMVDASVGGKTGVNHAAGKNLIGAFHQPEAVIIDPELVRSLEPRQIRSAYAEILKTAAISDRDFFTWAVAAQTEIQNLSAMDTVAESIARCCTFKARVVEEDEREGNRRRILNFGHTIGHALEGTAGYGVLTHGEAVAFGMVGAAWLSSELTGFDARDRSLLLKPLRKLELPGLPALDKRTVMEFMTRDKKTRAGKIHFVLLTELGKPVISTDVTEDQILQALAYIEEWQR